jgi:hypothetical protein
VHLVGGTVSPGVTVLEPRRAMLNDDLGALTIQGSLIVSETGEIELDVWGETAVSQDSLVVTGRWR